MTEYILKQREARELQMISREYKENLLDVNEYLNEYKNIRVNYRKKIKELKQQCS